MQKVLASIITIGDELLIGQTIDTNSAWIGQELNKAGVWVHRRVAVGDDHNEIWQSLDEEARVSNLILITGGLGPTADDITKPLLTEYFGGKLIVHEPTLEHVKQLFTQVFQRPMIERNLKQAEVPDVATILHNARGTAPGMWFEKAGKIFIAMPGVPHEMKGLMTNEVIPRLPHYFQLPAILHRTLFTAGAGESLVAERLVAFEAALPQHIKLAYLPSYGMVRMRLTSTGSDREALTIELDQQFAELCRLLEDITVVAEDLTMEEYIGRLLKEKSKTLATAESCTGGNIAHLITSIAGSSAYFLGGVVSYANQVKEDLLHVQPDTLQTVGAVSKETVEQMVKGLLQTIPADYAIATSGIMGPDGDTPGKPVGMVWIAVGTPTNIQTRQFNFRFDREHNIQLTSTNALNLLRKFILTGSIA